MSRKPPLPDDWIDPNPHIIIYHPTKDEIMHLRRKTGCGMLECKKALEYCGQDEDAQIEYLRSFSRLRG